MKKYTKKVVKDTKQRKFRSRTIEQIAKFDNYIQDEDEKEKKVVEEKRAVKTLKTKMQNLTISKR